MRSLRNKVDAVDDLMRTEGLDVLGITESWHEDSGDVCIARLRSLGYNVIEEARPIPAGARLDSVDFINHSGVVIVLSPGRAYSCARSIRLVTTQHSSTFVVVSRLVQVN